MAKALARRILREPFTKRSLDRVGLLHGVGGPRRDRARVRRPHHGDGPGAGDHLLRPGCPRPLRPHRPRLRRLDPHPVPLDARRAYRGSRPLCRPAGVPRVAAVDPARPRRLAGRRLPGREGALDGARLLRGLQPVVGCIGLRARCSRPAARAAAPRSSVSSAISSPPAISPTKAAGFPHAVVLLVCGRHLPVWRHRGPCGRSSMSTGCSCVPCSAPIPWRHGCTRSSRPEPRRSTLRPPPCGASSATCTTEPRRSWWPWPCGSAWPRRSWPTPTILDLDQVRELVDDAHRGAKEAIVELRDLARGIHPPALDIGLEGPWPRWPHAVPCRPN